MTRFPTNYLILEGPDLSGKTTFYAALHKASSYAWNIQDRSCLSMIVHANQYDRSALIHKENFKNELLNLNNRFVILLPGRITRWKGHTLLIEAISMLERTDIMCLFVGDIQGRKKYFKELHLLIDKFNQKNNFRIIDNQIDMAAIYKLADIVVSASLNPEAFGRVVAEAQAMGRSTLVANHGGAPEIIIDGVTGWLFKPGDATDLANKINKALNLRQDDKNKMAINAIERTKLNFNNEMMCARTLKVYEELVNK